MSNLTEKILQTIKSDTSDITVLKQCLELLPSGDKGVLNISDNGLVIHKEDNKELIEILPDQIKLIGITQDLSIKDVSLEMMFQDRVDYIEFSMKATIKKPIVEKLPAVDWLSWKKSGEQLSITGEYGVYRYTQSGVISIGNGEKPYEIPINLTRMGGGDWGLEIVRKEGEFSALPDFSVLTDLLKGQQFVSLIPQPLVQIVQGIGLASLSCDFNTKYQSVSRFSVYLQYFHNGDKSGVWPISNDLKLKDLYFSLILNNPILPKIKDDDGIFQDFDIKLETLEKASRQSIVSRVEGIFVIKEKLKLPVYLQAEIGTSTLWSLGLTAKPNDKPKFSDLLSVVGADDLIKTLPDGLQTLPDIQINDLSIGYNATNKIFEYVKLDVATVEPWKIIENYFTVERLQMQLGFYFLNNPKFRYIDAMFLGQFDMGIKLQVIVSKTKDVPWKIRATAFAGQSADFETISKKFIAKDAQLATVPNLNFSAISIEVIPEDKHLIFDAEVRSNQNNTWELGSLSSTKPTLELKQIKIHFDYQGKETKKISGYFFGVVAFTSIQFSAKAEFSNSATQGWCFTGKMMNENNVTLAEFVKAVSSSVVDVTVPDALNMICIKNIGFSYKTVDKAIEFSGKFAIGDTDAIKQIELGNKEHKLLNIDILLNYQKNQLKGYIKSQLEIGKAIFELTYDFNKTAYFSAALISKDKSGLLLNELLMGFGCELVIPPELNFKIKSISFEYYFLDKSLSLNISVEHKIELNLHIKYSFSIKQGEFELDIDKFKFKLERRIEKEGKKEETNYYLLAQIPQLNIGQCITDLVKNFDNSFKLEFPADVLNQATIDDFGVEINLTKGTGKLLPGVKASTEPPKQALVLKTKKNLSNQNLLAAQADENQTKELWIDIQRNLGPLAFNRIGLSAEKDLALLLDAGFDLGGLSVQMNGLSVVLPLDGVWEERKISEIVTLKGLDISFTKSPIEIAGGFQRSIHNGQIEYAGRLIVKTGGLNISALGAYSKDAAGNNSLFIFAVLGGVRIGPPYFTIEGFAGGFGYNRNLRLPTIDKIRDFPFISAAMGTSPIQKDDRPQNVLNSLSEYVQTELGTYWIVGGIKFSSFEMLTAFALFSISFGQRLEIALLGLAQISAPGNVPSGQDPLVNIEVALKAQFNPNEGFLSIEALLVPERCYLLSKDCRLGGGLAFYSWFDNAPQHAGDFILTVGGYHPRFNPPAHYPTKIPRLSINWDMSPRMPKGTQFQIKGEGYFALTPNVIMAGGLLELLWVSGPIKAHFKASADFLMGWQPFFYDAEMHIEVSASYVISEVLRSSIDVSVGAHLWLWGPDFAGRAEIDLQVVSFTIEFGKQSEKPKVGWDTFKQNFLLPEKKEKKLLRGSLRAETVSKDPEPSIYQVQVVDGLIQEFSEKSKANDPDWELNSELFALDIKSKMPIKTLTFNSKPMQVDNLSLVGIQPMGNDQDQFKSDLVVTLKRDGVLVDAQEIHSAATLGIVPKALWSPTVNQTDAEKKQAALAKEGLIEDTVLGISLQGCMNAGRETESINKQELINSDVGDEINWNWSKAKDSREPISDKNSREKIMKTISALSERRLTFLKQLNETITFSDDINHINVNYLSKQKNYFFVEPKLVELF